MRKITSKEKESKKQKRNQIILGGILLVVIFFSVISYAFGGGFGGEKRVEYNGFKFVQQNGFWIVDKEDLNLILRYNPYETSKIKVELTGLENYYNKPLYIDSKNPEASYEIYNNLGKIVQKIHPACLEEENCNEDYPIRSCKNNFILISEKENEKVWTEDNCLFIEGPRENLTKITDGVLLKVFEIEQ